MISDTAGPYDPRGNRILAALPQRALNHLRPHLESVELIVGDVLYRPGERIDTVYFPVIGVCSIVTDLEGPTVEVATVGDEGMVGLPVFLGVATSSERTLCQVPGRALQMDADRFRHEIAVLDGQLQHALQRFTQSMFTQLARNAGCIRGHRTHERCARWLLMTADRMHSDRFELTQKFLAQMLAVRRSSVSEVAGALAADGCIRYSRGIITILDRDRLQAHACSCYRVIREALDAALPPHTDTP
ncbi:Crp/Fnr family transcriptional regulator [Streptomyces kunmingensis]|uniref:Crp/Fnr family transcriptional regulator n=1 Tax=Streptomyces kunmingensis TaxID=68225 RepID=A0ABU6C8N5_9ACTN|nr:Crp/Fnr family transcriptional regulator [Streptomyces kunmingensis]MEB3961003.1 Crp/Fnr family transcriptional regulator [Streptomyces kunmingensis]